MSLKTNQHSFFAGFTLSAANGFRMTSEGFGVPTFLKRSKSVGEPPGLRKGHPRPLAALYACGAGVDSAKALWAEATSG